MSRLPTTSPAQAGAWLFELLGAGHRARRPSLNTSAARRQSDRASQNLRGFSTQEGDRQRALECGDEADDDSVTPVRQCWSIGSGTGSAGGSEPPPERLESPGEEDRWKRSAGQPATTVLAEGRRRAAERTKDRGNPTIRKRRWREPDGPDGLHEERGHTIGRPPMRCGGDGQQPKPRSAARSESSGRSDHLGLHGLTSLAAKHSDVRSRSFTRRTCLRGRWRRSGRSRAQRGATANGATQKSDDIGPDAAAKADSGRRRSGRRRSREGPPARATPTATTTDARFQNGKPRRASGIGHRQRGSAQRTLAGSNAMKTGRAQGKPGRSSKTAGWQRGAGDGANGSAGGESSGGR
jgi:hypothetical protein